MAGGAQWWVALLALIPLLTVGYGSPRQFWCDFISALRMTGYDHALSIEHEDMMMSPMEGMRKSVAVLRAAAVNQVA